MTPDEDEGRALLDRHCPILRYDSQGSFQADSPAVLTDRVSAAGDVANTLKRADGAVVASASGDLAGAKLDLGFLGWPKYRDGTKALRSDFLDATGRDYVQQGREMHRAPYADRIYGRVVLDDEGLRYLQYWLFYLFNNKAFLGFGLHEGDWEMVQIKLNTEDEPEAMAFAQHDHGQRCGWGFVEKLGVRPIVYVARGSQASFPRPGRHDAPVTDDVADGKGRQLSPTLEVLSDRSPAWVSWPGRWGSTKARNRLESNSPRGPAQHGQWDDPVTFHDEADEFDPRRIAPGPPPIAPPAPTVRVRRERDRAVIAYSFPKPTVGQPVPVQVVVSIDAESDELPPATYAFPVELPGGELEHPLELEAGSYRVLASAADAAGNSSETITARLR